MYKKLFIERTLFYNIWMQRLHNIDLVDGQKLH